MAIIAVTRTVITRPRHLVSFARGNLRAARQVRRMPGYVAGALGMSAGSVFWTMTVWEDGRAMASFRDSGAHAEEVPRMAGWAEEACTTIWRAEEASLPTWTEAHARLTQRARFHPVTERNEHQRRRVVPPTRGRVLTLPLPGSRGREARDAPRSATPPAGTRTG